MCVCSLDCTVVLCLWDCWCGMPNREVAWLDDRCADINVQVQWSSAGPNPL